MRVRLAEVAREVEIEVEGRVVGDEEIAQKKEVSGASTIGEVPDAKI
jgi:hypothetical protein